MELQKINDHLYVPTDFGKYHHYYADAEGDKEYTGITTILGVIAKPSLIGWAAKMAVEYVKANLTPMAPISVERIDEILEGAKSAHRKKKEAAGQHGTDAHALVEEYIGECLRKDDGKPLVVNPRDGHKYDAIRPFTRWAVDDVNHFLFSERRMVHPELWIAGTADFACVMKDGKRMLGDFKTSGGIYKEYWYQVAAYKLMAEYEGDGEYDGMVINLLTKDAKFETQYLYDFTTAKKGFIASLELYRAQGDIESSVVH